MLVDSPVKSHMEMAHLAQNTLTEEKTAEEEGDPREGQDNSGFQKHLEYESLGRLHETTNHLPSGAVYFQ